MMHPRANDRPGPMFSAGVSATREYLRIGIQRPAPDPSRAARQLDEPPPAIRTQPALPAVGGEGRAKRMHDALDAGRTAPAQVSAFALRPRDLVGHDDCRSG